MTFPRKICKYANYAEYPPYTNYAKYDTFTKKSGHDGTKIYHKTCDS